MPTIDYDTTPIKWELETVAKLSQLLGDPHTSYPSIHVAGTNGKGSTCYKIAYNLQKSGKKVGLFTSPHIHTFNERIQVNGQTIPDKDFNEIHQQILSHNLTPSFFETAFLAATLYFQKQKVDIAIFEVGLGGRLDATNIISPLLTIITSIGLDHTHILGPTLEDIAREKGGIIKPHTPLILGPNTHTILHTLANEKLAPLHQIPHSPSENNDIAKKALELLNVTLTDITVTPPCRFEVHKTKDLTIIYDVAHNPPAFTHLKNQLNQQVTVALGVGLEKDLEASLSIIETFASKIFLLPIKHPRLKKLNTPLSLQETLTQAITHAKSHNQPLLFTGSFYIMNAVKHEMSKM